MKNKNKEYTMPKKSNSGMANKSHKGHSPKKDPTQKPGPGARPDSGGGQPKKNHESRPTPGHVGKSAGGSDSAFDNIGKLGGGKKSKDGCLPKLFMLLLPFMAFGAYFFLNS